jgi:hypothetical protein
MVTGRKRNPYLPWNILQFTPGGLVVGSTELLVSIMNHTLRSLVGDKTAMYALTSELAEAGDDFIPFYQWTIRGIEALTDKQNLDVEILREIYSLINKEYKVRDGAYKMKRNFIQKLQYFLSGPSANPDKEKKTEGSRRGGRRGR